uniref:Uncharacterized protein n=1 Tax=Oryza sativa subsp. japonica TaxID=39947 RepID=Q2QXD2_ORYSJ|nr:hypothetical protein LOC_Os12g06430 [Oryza sativa Japonica Group]
MAWVFAPLAPSATWRLGEGLGVRQREGPRGVTWHPEALWLPLRRPRSRVGDDLANHGDVRWRCSGGWLRTWWALRFQATKIAEGIMDFSLSKQ